MGRLGTRKNIDNTNNFDEPTLLRDTDDIISFARDKGLYDGESLNLEQLISQRFTDIKIEKTIMESSQSGSLYYKDGKWVICLNRLHNPARQKFTLAHELGHYLMHKDQNTQFEDAIFFRDNTSNFMEFAANQFAANLLMPEQSIRNAIDNDGIKNVSRLASLFGVSASAILYRIQNLGYKIKS